jgi:hypothetical protein
MTDVAGSPNGPDDGDVTAPKDDRIGKDYQEGPNPLPGGDLDVSDRTIPPYDDRGSSDEERAAGVARAMGSEEPVKEPQQPGDGPPPAGGDTLTDDDQAPDDVGKSVGRRGEDQVNREGKEPGREEHGTEPNTGRPAGGSTPRDQTSINPHDDDRIS